VQGNDGEGGGQVGIALAEGLVAGIAPAAIGLLARLEGIEELAPPVVVLAGWMSP